MNLTLYKIVCGVENGVDYFLAYVEIYIFSLLKIYYLCLPHIKIPM